MNQPQPETVLKPVGFLQEFSRHPTTSLADVVGQGHQLDPDQLKKVLAYLRCEQPIYIVLDVIEDPISGEHAGSSTPLTDGEWVWPHYLAFFVEHHNFPLPADFLATIEERESPPTDLDVEKLQVPWPLFPVMGKAE